MSNQIECASCGRWARHVARLMCKSCYNRAYRRGNLDVLPGPPEDAIPADMVAVGQAADWLVAEYSRLRWVDGWRRETAKTRPALSRREKIKTIAVARRRGVPESWIVSALGISSDYVRRYVAAANRLSHPYGSGSVAA